MMRYLKKTLELFTLTLYASITMLGVCWGPPGPPTTSVPLGGAETMALTAVGIAAYGYWKMRK